MAAPVFKPEEYGVVGSGLVWSDLICYFTLVQVPDCRVWFIHRLVPFFGRAQL